MRKVRLLKEVGEGEERSGRHTAVNVSSSSSSPPLWTGLIHLAALLLQLSAHLHDTSVVTRERKAGRN